MRTSCFVLLCLLHAAQSTAATLTVSNVADSGSGSLRQAILDSNATTGPNTIQFAIPGSGPFTITLASQLPGITHSVTVDGYSQTGSMMNANSPDNGGLNGVLQIEVTYSGSCCIYGFVVGAKDGVTLTVQGLALNNIGAAAISGTVQMGTSQINAYGNYFGTTIEGTAANGTNGYAVATNGTPAQIGGQMPWQRNLVAGTQNGITISSSSIVEGNLIGTDVSGTQALANLNYGVVVDFESIATRIGGDTPAARNVISGNGRIGVLVENHYTGAGPIAWQIFGNYIGTDWTGTHPLPNGTTPTAPFGGVVVGSNSATLFVPPIGGFGPGEANLIAYNAGPGISADGNYTSASFDDRGNRIHHNFGVLRRDIDIGSTGHTLNDAGDADAGTNNVQNWPQVTAASLAGDQLSVTYVVDSATTHSTYPLRVDFYADIQGGSGAWIGEDIYTAANAQLPRSVTLTVPVGVKGMSFVATATTADGYSSEFSPAYDVIFEYDFE
jgi:hypothetical protein